MPGGNFALFYVEKDETLESIAQRAFGVMAKAAVREKVTLLQRLNPWLQNPSKVPAGSVLLLSPVGGGGPRLPTHDEICSIERELDLGKVERDKLIDGFPLYQGAASFGFQEVSSAVSSTLTFLTTPEFKEPYRAFKSAVKVGKEMSKGTYGNFFSRSPYLWQEVEGKLIRGLQRNIQYVSQGDDVFRIVPQGARTLAQEGGRVLIVNPTLGEFKGYADAVRKTKAIGKGLLSTTGTVLKGVDLGLYVNNLREATGAPDQNRRYTTETAKYGAGLAWGSASLGASGSICGYLTLSGGWPGAACAFVVVAGGSFASSKAAEKTSGWLYDAAKWTKDRVEEKATDVARFLHQGIYNLYFPGGPR